MTDIWAWRETDWSTADLTGYKVEATDGDIGKVDEATTEQRGGFIVVDTGPWIFGKKVMLPAGVIQSVDHDEGRIFVSRTKDEIKDAPEFDEENFRQETYRTQLGDYYSSPSRERTMTER
jgi:PRC-barrel domain